MWHQGQQRSSKPLDLGPSLPLSLCILTCAQWVGMKIRRHPWGSVKKLVSVSFVGGSDVLLTRLRLCKRPALSRSLVSVGRMAGVASWWVDSVMGKGMSE